MNLLVHALGAWMASEAASGRYPRPIAVGLTMLISRLGAPTAILALAGFAFKKLNDAGAFDEMRTARPASRRTPRR